MRNLFTRNHLITLVIVLLVPLAFLGSHLAKFGSTRLSDDPDDWATFADYYGFIVSLISMIVTAVLTYVVIRIQQARDAWDRDRSNWEQSYLRLQEEPNLVWFSFVEIENRGTFEEEKRQAYRLYNVGKGAAHNIILGKKPLDSAEITTPTVKAYSIPAGCYMQVDNWTSGSHRLYAYYESAQVSETARASKYLVVCEGDENKIIKDDTLVDFLKEKADRKPGISIVSY